MSNKAFRRNTCAALTATLTLLTGSAGAADLDLATIPLFIKADVPPNIMFLIDDSGSMNNIVPDAPYDATDSTYNTCPNNLSLGDPADIDGFDQIDAYIQADGDAYFRVLQSGTDPYYDWGNSNSGSNEGVTGRDKACFDPNQTYNARLYANDGNDGGTKDPGGYADGEYSGHYLNWYFSGNFGNNARNKPGTERRMDIATTAAAALIPTLTGTRVGLASYNGTDGADIDVGVGDNSGGHQTTLINTINNLTASGSTPIAESLHDIGRYFVGESGDNQYNGNLTLHPNSASPTTLDDDTVFNHTPDYADGVSRESPIQYYCQQNFAVLLTDGKPYNDTGIADSTGLRDYDGDCANASPACGEHDRKPEREYLTNGSDYLDDVAQALYEMDLRPDLDGPPDENNVPTEVTNNISTYTIGFADEQLLRDPLMQETADQGGGRFLTATNAAELVQAFKTATDDIFQRTKSSATSASFNVGAISSGARAFQALFDSTDWTGQLLAHNLHDGTGSGCSPNSTIGTVCTPPAWDAACVLTGGTCEKPAGTVSQNPMPANRVLITYDAVGDAALPFQWVSLTAAQQATLNTAPDGTTDTLGDERLDYLRGVIDLEQRNIDDQNNTNGFRNRTSLLGDIAHSSPVYVGPPDRFYPSTWKDNLSNATPPETNYETFRNSNNNRTGVVYVGANNGFLHGFSASNGQELLGFMPSKSFDNARNLTDPNYSHRFFVDGPLVEADVYYGGWHTVLMGALGRGGQGMYALDITTPSFSENSDPVLWEFTDADDADLGYPIGKGAVVRLHNGKWGAIFGNGYNNTEADGNASSSGNAVLYIRDIQDGTELATLDTGEGASDDPLGQNRPNGLASIFPVDKDGDFIADYVYGADLFGNIWRFDLTSTSEGSWTVSDFGNNGSSTPLFTAVDGSGTRQSVTTRVVANKHPNGVDHGVMVFFGTGKFLENGDEVPNTNITQTFYGIWDKDFSGVGDTINVNASLNTLKKHGFTRADDLQAQLIDAQATRNEKLFRRVTDNTVDWETQHGWYLDLKLSSGSNEGEMVIADPELRGGAVIFTSYIPSTSRCDPGGSGWLFVVDQETGGRFEESPFDVDGNNDFTTDDLIDFDGDDSDEAAGAIKLDDGTGGQSTVYAGDGKDVVVTGINPDVNLIKAPGKVEGRQTWRQLR